MYLKILFIVIGIMLFLLLSFYKLYLCKRPGTDKTPVYISVMGGFLALYIINALLLVIFLPDIISKSVMAFFAVLPFIIGKLATYEKENLYSYIQILFIFSSLIYTILI